MLNYVFLNDIFGTKNDNFCKRKDKVMWLDNLKALKKEKGLSSKKIAELTNLPERTVVRIFSGDTPHPYADTLQLIVSVLGGSLDEILAGTKAVVGSESLDTLQSEVDKLKVELELINAENVILKDKVVTLTAENDLLRTKLEYKEEIIHLHNYYTAIINALSKAEV